MSNSGKHWLSVVAGKGSEYFVVWSHDRYGTSYKDIFARPFRPFVSLLPLVLR